MWFLHFHTVRFLDGTFGVRRWHLGGWEFLCSHRGCFITFYTDEEVAKNCRFESLEAANLKKDQLTEIKRELGENLCQAAE